MGQKTKKKMKTRQRTARQKGSFNPIILGGVAVILVLCLHTYMRPERITKRASSYRNRHSGSSRPSGKRMAGGDEGYGAEDLEMESFDAEDFDPNEYDKHEITADAESGVTTQEDQSRVAAAEDLLAFMLNNSMITLHVPIQIIAKAGRGLGIFTKEKVAYGKPVMSVKPSSMLWSQDERLAVTLATQKRSPRDRLMELYMQTLPSKCPNNILHPRRSSADRDLVRKTRLHSVLEDAQADDDAFEALNATGKFSTEERLWAKCIVLSRRMRHFDRKALAPFLDLLNHGTSSRKIWHPQHGTTVVAVRDIPVGGEVTHLYTPTPSHLELLTLYGFPDLSGSRARVQPPAYSLLANDLPVSSPEHMEWLRQQGCRVLNYLPAEQDLSGFQIPKGYAKENYNLCRTDLFVDERGGMHQDQLRSQFRCLRLRMYSFQQAKHAVATKHLRQPWGGAEPVYEEDRLKLLELLDADGRAITSAGMSCYNLMPPKKSKELEAALMEQKASGDVGAGVLAELGALNACAALADKARNELSNALDKLEKMKLPSKPEAEEQGDEDKKNPAQEDGASEKLGANTKVVMFPDKSLGLRIEKGNAEAFVGDKLFNARVQTVKSKEALEQGVKAGDVLITVGKWSAEGASIHKVASQIKKHTSRPLKLTFATPTEEEDEFDF